MVRCSDTAAMSAAIRQEWKESERAESSQVEITTVNDTQIHNHGGPCWAIQDDWLLVTTDLDSMTSEVEHLGQVDRQTGSVRSKPGFNSMELVGTTPLWQLIALNEALPHAVSVLPSVARLWPPLGLILAGGSGADPVPNGVPLPGEITQVNMVQIDEGAVMLIETGPRGGLGWSLWPLTTVLPIMEPILRLGGRNFGRADTN